MELILGIKIIEVSLKTETIFILREINKK